MKILLTTLVAMIALALTNLNADAAPADGPESATDPADTGRAAAKPGATKRVGGDLFIKAEPVGERWACGPCTVDAPLPAGYPAPTPPGAIEIKDYPLVRRAEVSGKTSPDAGRYLAFWPLFNHIKSRKIAMTAPVEVDYRGMTSMSRGSGWTMSFLYRHRSLGDTGKVGSVRVKDAAAVKVISIGLKGVYDSRGARKALAHLEQWLAERPEWQAAGSPRALFYNGPMKRAADRWSEVQIPIRAASVTRKAPARDSAAEKLPIERSL